MSDLRKLVAGTAVGLFLVVPLPSDAGSYFPPPGDSFPVWSQDGTRVAFFTQRGGPHLESSAGDGSDERPLWIFERALLVRGWVGGIFDYRAG